MLSAVEPVPPTLLAELLELPSERVEALCDELALGYEAQGRGFVLVRVAGGYRYQTHPDMAPFVERYAMEGVSSRLSSAALETLAIVAYRQPVSRGQISALRGVNVDGVVRLLEQRGYIIAVGQAPGPGQPILYGTTPAFLEKLGIDNLGQLPRAEDLLLDSYRTELLAKGEDGKTVESAGPLVMGGRLDSSHQPDAYRAITYGKSTWILHMLRRRMGDQRFLALMAEIMHRYDHRAISTDEFRRLAASFLPPKTAAPRLEAFFDNWVYGTGIPALKLSWEMKGNAPALRLVGTVTESEVDEDFGTTVPVEIQLARGRAITQWVRAENDPVTFTVPLAQPPMKVTLDPNHAVLRR